MNDCYKKGLRIHLQPGEFYKEFDAAFDRLPIFRKEGKHRQSLAFALFVALFHQTNSAFQLSICRGVIGKGNDVITV